MVPMAKSRREVRSFNFVLVLIESLGKMLALRYNSNATIISKTWLYF